jgi:hypothetical protein
MIKIVNQESMIEVGDIFLHQNGLTQKEVDQMDEFDKYYEARELVKYWNNQPKEKIGIIKLGLEVMGIDYIEEKDAK